ncbi:MAG: SAM-dependent methyltransferase [Alphaproteobacteria bacterium]
MSLSLAFRLYARRTSSTLLERGERAIARLKTRWRVRRAGPAEVAPPVSPIPLELAGEEGPWSRARLELLGELWGPGFVSPGSEVFTMELVAPLAPKPSMRLLNLNAALGGAARTIAATCQMPVAAVEADATLARIGTEMSRREGLGERVVIAHCETARLGEWLGEGRQPFDGVFAKEGFLGIEDKQPVFAAIAQYLKPGGRLVFLDYVIGEAGISGRERRAWMEIEPAPPHPWTAGQMVAGLEAAGLEAATPEDLTGRIRRMTLQGWSDYARRLKRRQVPVPAVPGAILREVEVWARRVMAFERGGLRIMRFSAAKR